MHTVTALAVCTLLAGMPKGFAFVEFTTASAASKAIMALNNSCPPAIAHIQSLPLRITFARERGPLAAAGGGPVHGHSGGTAHTHLANLAADALGAAQAMQQYSGWEPKAFDEKAVEAVQGRTAGSGDAHCTASDTDGIGAGSSSDQRPSSGFVYDASTGYWHDPASGYYYDANTGLYYHPSAGQWYHYDAATGAYTAVGTGTRDASQQPQSSATATASAAGTTHAATTGAATATAGSAAAVAPVAVDPGRKRTVAVIGAKPVLNAQGLLAAAALQEVRQHACVSAFKAVCMAASMWSI